MRNVALMSLGVVMLLSIVAVASFETNNADAQDAVPIGADMSDLTTIINDAVSGDTIEMTENSTLSGNTNIADGVTLEDKGFSLTLPSGFTLNVGGTFISTGALDIGGTLTVSDGGNVSIENDGVENIFEDIDINGNVALILGTLNIYPGGSLTMGLETNSGLVCGGNGKLIIGGDLTLGNAPIYKHSAIEARNSEMTGHLRISEGSIFKVTDALTVGTPPSYTTDMSSDASVTGTVTLSNNAHVLVYGDAGFTVSSIKYPSLVVSTKFIFDNRYAYATEYKTNLGSKTLVFPSTDGLIDCVVENWIDSRGNVITPESSIQIGAQGYTSLYGVVKSKPYYITLTKDDSIRWVEIVNNVTAERSEGFWAPYNSPLTIGIKGDAPLPIIYVNGAPQSGTSVSFKVTGNTTFATSNNYKSDGGDGLTPLIILLAIIVVILSIALVMLITKYRKKTGT